MLKILKKVSPNFHISAMIVKDDSYNTNPETLKEVPKNYATMIVTITGCLANKIFGCRDHIHMANTYLIKCYL